jgi:hypothetical protein
MTLACLARTADILVTNHGTIVTFLPLSTAGEEWCSEHLPDDTPMMGKQYCVEHRYARDIADGMVNDGLEVE